MIYHYTVILATENGKKSHTQPCIAQHPHCLEGLTPPHSDFSLILILTCPSRQGFTLTMLPCLYNVSELLPSSFKTVFCKIFEDKDYTWHFFCISTGIVTGILYFYKAVKLYNTCMCAHTPLLCDSLYFDFGFTVKLFSMIVNNGILIQLVQN